MADLVASTSRTIKWISKSGTYTAQIISRTGDLWLRYKDEGDTRTVTPEWNTENGPQILLYILSSKAGAGLVTPTAVPTFYFNDVEIPIKNGAVSGAYIDMFQLVTPSTSGSEGCYGLKMINSERIALAAGYTNATIRMVATISLGSGSGVTEQQIECQYTINISQWTANGYFVTIAFENSDAQERMAITSDDTELKLICNVYQGSETAITPEYCEWYQADATAETGWTAVGGNTNELTVNKDMVKVKGTFLVKAYSGAGKGTYYGQDIQDVMDLSDPYEIEANPTPKDESVVEGSNVGVTYKPILYQRGSSTTVSGATFNWAAYDAEKVMLEQGSGVTEFTVSYGAMAQANSDVSVVIEALDPNATT